MNAFGLQIEDKRGEWQFVIESNKDQGIGRPKSTADPLLLPSFIQVDYVGFNPGNGEKPTYRQAAGRVWYFLAAA